MIGVCKYYVEKFYPLLLSLCIVFIMKYNNLNYINNKNMDNAIEGVLTVSALIIGFVGAVLPVVLSMKNDSKFVKYIFERDKDKLFMKYMKITLVSGLLTIVISISLYFRAGFSGSKLYNYIFFVWSFCVVLFMLSTYRCINHMLNLFFSSDNEISDNDNNVKKSEYEEILEKNDKSYL